MALPFAFPCPQHGVAVGNNNNGYNNNGNDNDGGQFVAAMNAAAIQAQANPFAINQGQGLPPTMPQQRSPAPAGGFWT